MALSASTVWEVRTTGSDSNGGGFVTGASGTDFSQQTAAQFALTNVTTAAANAICLSASAAATMVGNICQIISGTNFTTGFYQIISVVAGVSFTVDRNCTTAAGALGVINIGGCLATISKVAVPAVAGNIVYVKATGTYSVGTGLSFTNGGATANFIRLLGYTTTRGDVGPVTVQASAGITILTVAAYTEVQNFVLDGNSQNTNGLRLNGNFSQALNVWCKNLGNSWGINAAANNNQVIGCTVSGCDITEAYQVDGSSPLFVDCVATGNTNCIGFNLDGSLHTLIRCVAANSTGASSHGFVLGATFGTNSWLVNCLSYAMGGSGINISATANSADGLFILNSIFYGNSGFGITSGSLYNWNNANFNAFGANTSGARNNFAAGPNDITLTADPTVAGASNNFALNTTAGGGALLRATGVPGALLGTATTGFLDVGPVQHQDSPTIFVESLNVQILDKYGSTSY